MAVDLIDRLALGQDRHRRIVAIKACGEDVTLDQTVERPQDACTYADLIGERRDGEFDPLMPEAIGLPVQRQMLAKPLEQYGRQQVLAEKSRVVSREMAQAAG